MREDVKSMKNALPLLSVYFDQDGVLADFDGGLVLAGLTADPALNKSSAHLSQEDRARKRALYAAINDIDFFLDLPAMPGARALWAAATAYEPIILTAAPDFGLGEEDPGFHKAARQKKTWVDKMIEPLTDDRFICTVSARKTLFLGHRPARHHLLIDDRTANIEAWIAAGGIGILHKNAETSIAAMNALARELRA